MANPIKKIWKDLLISEIKSKKAQMRGEKKPGGNH